MSTVFISDHRRNEELSLRYHQAIAEELRADPDRVLAIARNTLARWMDNHRGTGAMWYLEQWDALLRESQETLLELMASPSQEARDMRQCSPFAGVLSNRRRLGILSEFSREWRRGGGLNASRRT